MGFYSFVASRVFVHRWPNDAPEWTRIFREIVCGELNTEGSPVRVVALTGHGGVSIAGHEFGSLKNVGISVPFFKDECRMIFEARCYGNMYVHAHVYVRENHIEVFNRLAGWKTEHGL